MVDTAYFVQFSLDLFNNFQIFTSVNLFVFQIAVVSNKLYLLPSFIFSVKVARVMPLFRLTHSKPMKPCQQNIWRTA